MDEPFEDPSPEVKKARVKELEQIVKKLEHENKQLLNKVRTSSPTLKHRERAAAELGKMEQSAEDNLEDAILDLEDNIPDTLNDGEWLYVSPKLPLTPAQKKQAPLQWLSEGHGNRLDDGSVPSLDEVRKALVFNMEEAETLSKAAHPRPNASNRTAQKYLSRVRERSRSNSPPVLPMPQHNGDYSRPEDNVESLNEDVPVVKWKARMPQEETEDVPVVKWKARMPREEAPETEDVPVVKWKARMPQEETPEDEDVPVVKWKARMPQEGAPKSVSAPVTRRRPQNADSDVPVVRWKAKMPQEEVPENEDVPVIRRRAKMPQGEGEDIPVVKWKAKMPQEEDEDVPVVRRKARMPQENTLESEDVPVVKWKARMPTDGRQGMTSTGSPGQSRAGPRNANLARPISIKRNEATTSADETSSENSELNQSGDFEQRGLRAPGLRQPQSSLSPTQSPTNHQSRLSPGKGLRKARKTSPGQPQSLRSRSPSPSTQSGGRRQLARPVATSPARQSLSPGRSQLAQPGASPKTKRQIQPSGSPSSLRHPLGLPAAPKQEGTQRMSRLQAHREGQQKQSTPPQSGGIRTPGSSGMRGPSSLGSGKTGPTPPRGGMAAKPRRVLPTTPNSAPARQQQGAEDDGDADSWLEGCF